MEVRPIRTGATGLQPVPGRSREGAPGVSCSIVNTERSATGITRFGLQIPNFTYPAVANGDLFSRISDMAVAAEESGFDSIWVMDHFYQIAPVGPRTDPMLEAYTLLGGIAARTRTASVGTLVSGVTYRNPALLAKAVTTLDIVSGGRAILGIGAAWNEDEHAGYGFPFPPLSERMDRLEEALQICRAMFIEQTPSFTGRHHAIHEALNNPRPLRPGGIPILVGGSAERRTLALVAKYADVCNLFGDIPTIHHKIEAWPTTARRSAETPPRSPRPGWEGWLSLTPQPRRSDAGDRWPRHAAWMGNAIPKLPLVG